MNLIEYLKQKFNERYVQPHLKNEVTKAINKFMKNYLHSKKRIILDVVDEAIIEFKRQRLYEHFRSFNEVKYGDREHIIETYSSKENELLSKVQKAIENKLNNIDVS